MRENRRGESGAVPFRSGRLFSVGNKRYFATREGIDHGPFDSREEAEKELKRYLRAIATTHRRFFLIRD